MGDSRILRLTNQGAVYFYEQAGNGADYVAISAPDALAANLSYKLPSTILASGFLMTDGSGNLSWATGTATMQIAYDNGEDITCASKTMAWSQANDAAVLQLNKTASGAGTVLSVQNAGTGYGLQVAQTGDMYALYLSKSDVGSYGATYMSCARNGPNSFSFYKTGTGAGACVFVDNDGTGPGVEIKQDGAGSALKCDGSLAVLVDLNQTGNFTALDVRKTGSGIGYCAYLEQAGTYQCLRLLQTGAASALYIDQDGADYALRVDAAAAADGGIYIANQSANYGLNLLQTGAQDALYIDQQTANQAAYFLKSNGGGGAAVVIENDGTGYCLSLDQDGVGVALRIDSAAANSDMAQFVKAGAGTGNVIKISNSGTGPDIEGTSATWNVRPGGGGVFAGLTLGADTARTISTAGAIATTQDMCCLSVSANSGVTDDLDTITGGVANQLVVLRAASGHTITVRDGTGNINLPSNRTLNAVSDLLVLLYSSGSGYWSEWAYADNA